MSQISWPFSRRAEMRANLHLIVVNCFISSVRSSNSHPDLLVIQQHHPLFQITPVLNTGLLLSEPLQLYRVLQRNESLFSESHGHNTPLDIWITCEDVLGNTGKRQHSKCVSDVYISRTGFLENSRARPSICVRTSCLTSWRHGEPRQALRARDRPRPGCLDTRVVKRENNI